MCKLWRMVVQVMADNDEKPQKKEKAQGSHEKLLSPVRQKDNMVFKKNLTAVTKDGILKRDRV